ncbi:MAG: tetratricopeptide repeat protein [Bryobacterales bacterium]|nr:tetratricopeptide repeat protein [Bryobacterales bacterium]
MSAAASAAPTSAARVGVDPIECVHVMENHDQAYCIWRDAGVKDRILVHIDAHHDMWWIDDNRSITIANFICPALKEGIVREVYWVVPDATWEGRAGQRAVLRHLRKILKKYPESSRRPKIGERSITATVLGKPLTVCPLASLPVIAEQVLLDLDTDYLLIPRVSYGESDAHSRLPWRWPGELVARIASSAIRARIVTVAYSVEGGYTPLKWKYLGDELALRIRQPEDSRALAGLEALGLAAQRMAASDHPGAEREYRRAQEILPASAAPLFHLALHSAQLGRMEEARRFYADALAADPSYRSPYLGNGFVLQWDGHREEAARAHRAVIEIDPANHYACLGLAQIAAQRRQYAQAEDLFRRVLALTPDSVDAQRGLAKLLSRRGLIGEAVSLYESSMRLALHGHRPLAAPIVTDDDSRRLLDSGHSSTYEALAALYAKRGDAARAIAACRISIAGSNDGFLIRWRLAGLYLGRKNWREAGVNYLRMFARAPSSLRATWKRASRRLKRRVRSLLTPRRISGELWV